MLNTQKGAVAKVGCDSLSFSVKDFMIYMHAKGESMDPAIQGDTVPLSIHKCQLPAKINLCVGINSHGLLLEVKLEKI